MGGEWSQYYQGRLDDQQYRTALNVLRNAIPLEEGAWTRRPGTRYAGTTRGGARGILRKFFFNQAQPYALEFTPGHLRMWSGPALVLENLFYFVVTVSSATPAVVKTQLPHHYATGDEIQFILPDGDTDPMHQFIVNKTFQITVSDGSTFTLSDPVTSADIDGSLIVFPAGTTVQRVVDFQTPYSLVDLLDGIQVVQDIVNGQPTATILQGTHAPLILTQTAPPDSINFGEFTFGITAAWFFIDGPYMDLIKDGSTLTPSASGGGVITFTVGYNAWSSSVTYGTGDIVERSGSAYTSIVNGNLNNDPSSSSGFWELNSGAVGVNGGKGFVPPDNSIPFEGDVTRLIRILSEPALWDSGTSYATGDTVKFNGQYWVALAGSTGVSPDTDATKWAVAINAAQWTWGMIIVVNSASSVDVVIRGGDLPTTNVITTWQVGMFGGVPGWPTTGCFHEGRAWYASKRVPNRYAGTVSNGAILEFTPTALDGTVGDANGIVEPINSGSVAPIFWMLPDHGGILVGTQEGEYQIAASALNDPLTPTSIQTHLVTAYGQEDVLPINAGLSKILVQRYAKKALEYISDPYTGKFSGTNISIRSKHLLAAGLHEIALIKEPTPIVWAASTDGSISGMTYRRESPFSSQPANFSGWHRHDLGTGRLVESIVGGPSPGGAVDAITLITNDPVANVRWVEIMTEVFDEDTPIEMAWFLDGATPGTRAQYQTDTLPHTVTVWGFERFIGETIQVWGDGYDVGDFVVQADGSVVLPVDNAADGPLTEAILDAITAQGAIWGIHNVTIAIGDPTAAVKPDVTGIVVPSLTGGNYPDSINFAINWDRSQVYLIGAGNTTGNPTPGPGITSLDPNLVSQNFFRSGFSMIGDSVQTADRFLGQGNQFSTIDNHGRYYIMHSSTNYGQVSQFDPALSKLGTIGIDSAFPGASAFPQPNTMTSFSAGGHDYVLMTRLFSLATDVVLIDTDPFAAMSVAGTPFGPPAPLRSSSDLYACPGPSFTSGGHQGGTAFVLLVDDPSQTINVNPAELYTITVAGGSPAWTANGTVTPAQISNHSYHQFDQHPTFGMMLDKTDGNPIAIMNLHQPTPWDHLHSYSIGDFVLATNNHSYESRTNTNVGNDPTTSPTNWTDLGSTVGDTLVWLVKFRNTPGVTDVVWAIPIPGGFPASLQFGLNTFNVKSGKVALLANGTGSGLTLLWVDTLAGLIISNDVIPGFSAGLHSYDANTGRVVVFGTDDASTPGHPVPTPPGAFSAKWAEFSHVAPPSQGFFTGPFVGGLTYTSQGQLLMPVSPVETGARNGPALGKTRRTNEIAFLLARTQGISYGTDFGAMNPLRLRAADDATPLAINVLFSGVVWDNLEDDYSLNSQPAWEVTRPYPATVLAIEGFLETQDRS